MDVTSVDNTSLDWPTLKPTREFTPERNLMDVTSVDNTSLDWPTLKATREFTLERKQISCPIHSSSIGFHTHSHINTRGSVFIVTLLMLHILLSCAQFFHVKGHYNNVTCIENIRITSSEIACKLADYSYSSYSFSGLNWIFSFIM